MKRPFQPWGTDPAPQYRHIVPNVKPSDIATMQRVADRLMPHCVSMPVSVVYRTSTNEHSTWTFHTNPVHDTITGKIETIAKEIADAVTNRTPEGPEPYQ